MTPQKAVLCVDDNADTCDLLKFVFQKSGIRVETCSFPEEAIRRAREAKFDAIVLDFHLSAIDGVDLCRIIRTFDSFTPIIFFSAEARAAKKQEATDAGAQAFLVKPNDFEKLVPTVCELINENAKTNKELKIV
ncbi:MAG: response regulator [Acidobacteriota bacterium]|nr:response regulator [Acidobacteriota bacterium]